MSLSDLCIWQLSQLEQGRPDRVDGDEDPRSGGVVTLEGVPEGGDGEAVEVPTATASNETEPADETSAAVPEPDAAVAEPEATAVAEPDPTAIAESDATVIAEPDATAVVEPDATAVAEPDATVVAEPVDAVSESGDAESTDPAADPEAVSAEADTRPADAQPGIVPVAAVPSPRRTAVRRGLVATAVALVVALSVSAFAMVGPTTADVDQHFVDTARTQGHAVASGDQETLIVSAAHKLCDRRENHSTVAQRRATALSPEELGAIQQTFTTDVGGFTALALDTYCPN